ncbi:MAG: (2Fe-2S)-binding protein [Rhodospirillum sp.]|nr:(2Fe-2S)-binding protein [Rhodospirillum sp.]MCF8491615.1 (2Fe-2S)-binding protein [Rhodospirillum sp.]MCF8499524.1 (2Fe-2S)-binding protein [Rhodospirillum sp.]
MYVCVCHALTDRHVREDAQAGAKSAGAVFSRRGVRPVCGKCVGCMRSVLDETRKGRSDQHQYHDEPECQAAE